MSRLVYSSSTFIQREDHVPRNFQVKCHTCPDMVLLGHYGTAEFFSSPEQKGIDILLCSNCCNEFYEHLRLKDGQASNGMTPDDLQIETLREFINQKHVC